MDMHVTVEIVDASDKNIFDEIYDYFTWVDETFSPFKPTSEVSKINDGRLKPNAASREMREILALCAQTTKETDGFFDIHKKDGTIDPSGLVKGWAIWNAAKLLDEKGCTDYYVDAGGDIAVSGKNAKKLPWTVGIRNPFNTKEIVKVIHLNNNEGVATSGTYERGAHIYNPKTHQKISDIVSLTVIGPNVYEADRFATAAFAMGREGIRFLEHLKGFEGYMIDTDGLATQTSGFDAFVKTI